jgi:signal transduction histidine kinase
MRVQVPPRLLLAIVATFVPDAMGAAAEAQPQPVRTVVGIYWSTEDFPANRETDPGIREALLSRTGARVDFFAEYLESDRFPEEQASQALRAEIRVKYANRRIDLVLANGDPALQFVIRHRAELFPGAPIVFLGTDAGEVSGGHEIPDSTGIVTRNGYVENFELALTLHPGTRHVFIIAQAPVIDLERLVRSELQALERRVQMTYIHAASISDLIAAVKAVPAGSLIYYARYSQEAPGAILFPTDVARLIADASPVPVYSDTEPEVGMGVVGGAMIAPRALGLQLGNIANRVLDGAHAEQIPIARARLVPTFDWRQVRRWNIDPSLLPPGSDIRFRVPTAWEMYRWYIVSALALLALQSLLIAGLVFEHRRRRKAEIESRRNLTAIAHLDRRAAMGELATSLAHELNQPLNAILQNAGVAQMLLTSNPVPPALGEMTEIVSDIRKDDLRASEVIRRMRGMLQKRELEARPVDLNEVALETVAIVQPDARSRRIEMEVELSDRVRPVLGDSVHLQQVLLNLLMNAMDAVCGEPSERQRVRVSTAQRDGVVRLSVSDRGSGIPTDRLAQIFEPFYTTKRDSSGMGMGLAIARGIVEAHGGRMAAENNATGGATVWFSIPIPPNQADVL